MSELSPALISIAGGNEFLFARFYIVCEVVPLGTPGSPLIVCGLPDTLRECSNVEETRNQMQTFRRKKCSHFSPTNSQLHFHMKSSSVFLIILLIFLKENGTISRRPALLRVRSDAASAHIFPDEPEDGTDC